MDTEEGRLADYLARVVASVGDPEIERLAWALCPFLLEDFDYPRLKLPECEKCEWTPGPGGVRGCRSHAQQVALAARAACVTKGA